jgi:hypothetical protein
MRARALKKRYGHFADAGGSVIQALLFPTGKFTVAEARAWAVKHRWKANDVDSKESFIHLRQKDPSQFKRIRTIYLGGSGVMARVGWK